MSTLFGVDLQLEYEKLRHFCPRLPADTVVSVRKLDKYSTGAWKDTVAMTDMGRRTIEFSSAPDAFDDHSDVLSSLAHEAAHLLVPVWDLDHGARWRREFLRLVKLAYGVEVRLSTARRLDPWIVDDQVTAALREAV